MASKLLNETTYAQEKLNNLPDNVVDFVGFSKFLYTINARQHEFGERGAAVHAIYALMGEYGVPVPDADAASVKMMETVNGSLSHLVAQVESQQEERTTGFTEEIETGIAQLRTKADELMAESEDASLFDGNTDMADALSLLGSLDERFQARWLPPPIPVHVPVPVPVPVPVRAPVHMHVHEHEHVPVLACVATRTLWPHHTYHASRRSRPTRPASWSTKRSSRCR